MLECGDWQRGWQMYEQYVWKGIFDPIEEIIPEWHGEHLLGRRILIVPIGGLGDQFMFFRWFRLLHEMGAHITYMCPDTLECLLLGHPWVDKVVPVTEGEEAVVELKEYDCYSPLMALPMRLNATVETIPRDGPYLGKWQGGDKIGLCTKAGEFMDNNGRSMNRMQEEAVKNAREDWVSLNYGENPNLRTWQDTARTMEGLKAVVSVDTSVMHLAGAMGIPVLCWPGKVPNWKFFGGRTDSPFYPSMKVIYGMENLVKEAKSL